MLGVILRWTSITIQKGVEKLLVALSYGNQDELWTDGPQDLYADLTILEGLQSWKWTIFIFLILDWNGLETEANARNF